MRYTTKQLQNILTEYSVIRVNGVFYNIDYTNGDTVSLYDELNTLEFTLEELSDADLQFYTMANP